MTITWTKFGGTWALRSSTELALHSEVEVARRDGGTTSATPCALLWSGAGAWIYRPAPRTVADLSSAERSALSDPALGSWLPPQRRRSWG